MNDEAAYKLIVIGDSGVGKSNLALRYSDGLFFADGAPTIGMDFKYARCVVDLSPNDDDSLAEEARAEGRRCGQDANGTTTSRAGALSSTSSASSSPPVGRQIGVRLQIWDTAGAEGFAILTAAFYRSCHGIMLCFDLTNRSSFEHLDRWYSRVAEHAGPKIPPLVLVGCKLDLVRSLTGTTPRDGNARNERRAHSVDEFNMRSPEPQARPGSTGLLLRGATHSMRQVDTSEAEEWARRHAAVLYLETSAKEDVNVDWAFRYLAAAVVRQALSSQPPLPTTNSNDDGTTVDGVARRPSQSLRRGPSREAHSRGIQEDSAPQRRRCC